MYEIVKDSKLQDLAPGKVCLSELLELHTFSCILLIRNSKGWFVAFFFTMLFAFFSEVYALTSFVMEPPVSNSLKKF